MEVSQSFEVHNGTKEEETSLDGEFIKVEKETFDVKGSSHSADAKAVESEVRSDIDPKISDASSIKELMEAQTKVKELEIELDKLTKALKDSESENVQLKGQLSFAKDKVEQMAEGEDKLNTQIKNLQEDLEILLSKHKEHSGIKEAFGHQNAELESSKKKMEDLEHELQSSVSDSKKFEELHLRSASHLESETKRAEELERLVEAAKLSAKEAEDQMASLQEELKGLRGKIVENEKMEASLKSTTVELSAKDSLIDEIYKEVDLVKNSERQLKENMLALESVLASTQNDLQLKVSELEVSAKELAKAAAEKQSLEAAVADLTNNVEQMKSAYAELETKLKLSKQEFVKADAFSAELTIKNAELGLKLKSFEELLSESKSLEASALQKNLESEDLIRAASSAAQTASSAAQTARLQMQDYESQLEAAELKNKELEGQLTFFESKHGDTDRDLKEHREKLSELQLKLKDLETEKDQMKVYQDLLAEAASKAAALSEELDRASTKGAYLESLNEELKKMMDETENRAAQLHSENELLAETNSQLKSKVNELQQLFNTATAEKEEAARQLASHVSTLAELTNQHARSSELQSGMEARILQVETLLEETIEKLAHNELEAKELSERYNSSEEKVKAHEITARESVEIAETRKIELDQTRVKVQEQQKHIESLETKLEQLEMHLGALSEANMKLNEELAVSESKLNDLQSKLSAALADKDDAVQNMNSSMKKVEDLTQDLTSERQRFQTEISSIMEQKQHLSETNVTAQNELQTSITLLEGQLKEHQERNGALKSDLENLRREAAQNSALQARMRELEEKLLVTEADHRKEVESVQALAAATVVDLTSTLEQHLQKTKDDDAIKEKLQKLQHELTSAQSTITELKEENNHLVSTQGSGVKQSSEELEAKTQQVVLLEKHVKELEQKLHTESMISKEPGDGAEVRSRDIGSNLSSPTKRKSKKSGSSSSSHTPSASTETQTKTIEAPSLNNLKLVLGVALVSIIIGLILGKRY